MSTHIKFTLLFLFLLLSILLSLSMGNTFINPLQVLWSAPSPGISIDMDILLKLRMPRTLMALIIGASLSVSGLLFQALLKNPLSDPYTTGVSGGAALGATLAIVCTLPAPMVIICAFLGSLGVILLVYLLSKRLNMGSVSLILGGIALSFVLSSGVLLVYALSRASHVHKALLWLMGDLSIARYAMFAQSVLLCLVLIFIVQLYYKQLNIISFGDHFARNLGVGGSNIRNIFWIASLLAAIPVALAGVIGFIGIIVPHSMRYIFGPDHRVLLPATVLGGGLFLVLSDALGRSIAVPYEIPVGIITGFFGGLFFLALLIQKGSLRQ